MGSVPSTPRNANGGDAGTTAATESPGLVSSTAVARCIASDFVQLIKVDRGSLGVASGRKAVLRVRRLEVMAVRMAGRPFQASKRSPESLKTAKFRDVLGKLDPAEVGAILLSATDHSLQCG